MNPIDARKGRTSFSLFAAALALLWAAQAGAATWLPFFTTEARRDDNILHIAGGSPGSVAYLAPELRVRNNYAVTSWEAHAKTGWSIYSDQIAQTSRADAAEFQISHKPTEFTGFNADVEYLMSLDPIDFVNGVVLQRGTVSNTSATGGLALWRADANATYRNWQYEAGDLADGNALVLEGHLLPYRTRVTAATVGFLHQDLEIASKDVLTLDTQTIGYRRNHTNQFRSEAEIGHAAADYHDGSPIDHQLSVAVGLYHAAAGPRSPVDLKLRAKEDIVFTGLAELGYDMAGRYLSLGVEKSLDAEGGLYRYPTLTRRGTFAARDTMGAGQVFEVSASISRVRPFRGIGTNADIYRASVVFSQPMGPFALGRIGYDFLRQNAASTTQTGDFDRNRFTVAIVAGRRQ